MRRNKSKEALFIESVANETLDEFLQSFDALKIMLDIPSDSDTDRRIKMRGDINPCRYVKLKAAFEDMYWPYRGCFLSQEQAIKDIDSYLTM